jgi:hypothetical protein
MQIVWAQQKGTCQLYRKYSQTSHTTISKSHSKNLPYRYALYSIKHQLLKIKLHVTET